MTLLAIGIGCVALLALGRCLFALTLMLYVWGTPERLSSSTGPTEQLRDSEISFTVLLPARAEEAVVGQTIASLWAANYPRELLEVIVICQEDDGGTIAAASQAIEALDYSGVRLVTYGDPPFNKPHALMVGYGVSSNDVIAVFDAEDDVHPDIFGVVNTAMLEERVKVVQGGVQLMNFREHWFSALNCLEYFFYYGSTMHFNARVGMVPLGGNTVFVRRELVDRVGGWDLACLTEDADLGIRVSALGEPISVVYNPEWVTREETPHSISQFVKQRTRWHQGFLQILGRGAWLGIHGGRARLLALVTLCEPILAVLLLVNVALIPVSMLLLRLPDVVTMLTFLPLYGMLLLLAVNFVGLVIFGRTYGERVPLRVKLVLLVAFLPFQWMIAFSALRALSRQASGRREWEKTEHRGAHRTVSRQLVDAPAQAAIAGQEEPVA